MNDCGVNIGIKLHNGEVKVASCPEMKIDDNFLQDLKTNYTTKEKAEDLFKGRIVVNYLDEIGWLMQLSSEFVTDALLFKDNKWYRASKDEDWEKFKKI